MKNTYKGTRAIITARRMNQLLERAFIFTGKITFWFWIFNFSWRICMEIQNSWWFEWSRRYVQASADYRYWTKRLLSLILLKGKTKTIFLIWHRWLWKAPLAIYRFTILSLSFHLQNDVWNKEDLTDIALHFKLARRKTKYEFLFFLWWKKMRVGNGK